VDKIIFHPKYNTPNPFKNDIALIRLSAPVVENGKKITQETKILIGLVGLKLGQNLFDFCLKILMHDFSLNGMFLGA
jgi:hypothetical protein